MSSYGSQSGRILTDGGWGFLLLSLRFEARGEKLAKKDLFGKSDPFLVISRSQESGGFVPIHKTEVVKKNLNPQWEKFGIPIVQLCNGDEYRPLLYVSYLFFLV
jgi:copine 5/8/9